MTDKLGSVTNESVQTSTGKSWDEWITIIDGFGGETLSHKDIAAKLVTDNYIKSSWWAQSITVGYEYAKGRRVKGETKDAGFEVGVQRMMYAPQTEVWKFLTSSAGQKIWLGEVPKLGFAKGETFETKDGTTGEIRGVDSGEKVRLRWQPQGRGVPTTLQIYLFCSRNTPEKTNVRFHQENLADSHERSAMKQHWHDVLERLEAEMKQQY